MNRRGFLGTGAASVIVAGVGLSRSSVASAQTGANTEPTGIRMVPVVKGKYKVWTRKSGNGPIKVLLLHGGPGISHEYLEAVESFLPPTGIEIYYYDQLGCNNSDQPDDPSLWTLPRYVEEVEEVRQQLGLEQFVLYGHSWGGILAIDYALKYQRHLRALVISNMCAGTRAYLKRAEALKVQMLPPASLARLRTLEARGDYANPDYQRLMTDELYPQMMCRTTPWPEPVTRAFGHLNPRIYVQMWGAGEFALTGNLKDWERWDRLHEIKVRALTIGSMYDEMDPDDMKKMATLMPNASSFICPQGSHLCMWDDQAFYFKNLLRFLQSV